MLISFWPPCAWLLRPLRNWHMEAYHYCLASCWCDAGRDFQMVRCFRVSTNQFICEPKRPVELRNYKHYYAVYIKPLQHGLLISPLEKPETTSTSAASHSPFNPCIRNSRKETSKNNIPTIGSMYGILYIYLHLPLKDQPNVGKYMQYMDPTSTEMHLICIWLFLPMQTTSQGLS